MPTQSRRDLSQLGGFDARWRMHVVRSSRLVALCDRQSTVGWTRAGYAVSASLQFQRLDPPMLTSPRYHSIRIDAVHYCELEYELCKKRKRKSHRFDRSGETEDVPGERLHLLCETVRTSQYLASQVHYLKMPYMTRESCLAHLARTVSVLPNLRFVDLPDGVFRDSPSSNALTQELQSNCHDLRKMKYATGAEATFSTLPQSRLWQNLEVLELWHLSVEPSTIVHALSSFPVLREVKLIELPLLDDSIFTTQPQQVSLPPLNTLSLQDTPNISASGLITYLSRPENREHLSALYLNNTGVMTTSLHQLLAAAPYLTTLHITETVSRALQLSLLPPLSSRCLRSLHFLISSPHTSSSITSLTISARSSMLSESYYNYLASSILGSHLPALQSLYALSTSLPLLLLPPPSAPFTQSSAGPSGIPRPLALYTKAILEMEWQYTYILPPSPHNRRGSATATRPLSLYGDEVGGICGPKLGDQWGGRERDSVLVGNGFGGFLAVPSDEGGKVSPRKGRREVGGWMG